MNLPNITKNLLIINVLMYLAQLVFEHSLGIDLAHMLGLHFFKADEFAIWQMFTYLFLHGSFMHLFFNMFSLWMFGRIIEQVLGEKRFLIYYFVCGIGAAVCQEIWQLGEYYYYDLAAYDTVNLGMGTIMPMAEYLNQWTTIGASGACYGVLLAFGFTFPNERIMLMFPPIPMKSKYFVVGYAAIELFSAFGTNSNIAHFAHLGGMIFGWLLLMKWRNGGRRNRFTGWDDYQHPSQKRNSSFIYKLKKRLNTVIAAKPSGDGYNLTESFNDRGSDYDYNLRQKQRQLYIDSLLDKVKHSGYESLTEEEKKELFRHN